VLLGLGSIVGTGIFVSVGLAAGVAGSTVVVAVVLAALVAAASALSTAQLAATHPVSGGTYEYGYRYLSATFGVVAGWAFLVAKTASAATAALGFAGYLLDLLGLVDVGLHVPLALAAVACFTALVAAGIRRTNVANGVIVTVAIGALLLFVVVGAPSAVAGVGAHLSLLPTGRSGVSALLHATALMFVAYTGYGRIATLGEEVRRPARTIPWAIILTLAASLALYLAVSLVAVGSVGADLLADYTRTSGAPLEDAARTFGVAGLPLVVTVGALVAMLGVLLNLVLGLSRVVLAMARRRDLPGGLAEVRSEQRGPTRAVLLTGVAVAALVLTGDIGLTWSVSAFTVLVYYAITNLAVLRLPAEARRYPRWIAAAGLAGCLGVGVWVETRVWVGGLAVILLAVTVHAARSRLGGRAAGG
jgi:APA family basic amino acid/polyamine antiporter